MGNMLQIFTNSVHGTSGLLLANDFYSGFSSVFASILKFIFSIFYLIVKWILLFIDIVFSYIQQLAGLNMNFNSFDSILSKDSDMVFNLLWSSKDVVVPIVKALIVLAIVIIILCSIASIIKTSLKSLNGDGKNQTVSVIRTMLKAFVLMVITPAISIIGIIASNAILQVLYNATNPTGAVSLGTQIFSASTTAANSFRLYANNNMRIPITYDFSRANEALEYYDGKEPTTEFLNYLQSTDNVIYTTYLMFNTNEYVMYDTLNNSLNPSVTQQDIDAYYKIYDVKQGLSNADSDSLDYYKRIENAREEYFVMADIVDFCIRSSTQVYYKTIEQVLRSIVDLKISSTDKNRIFETTVSYFNIKFLNKQLNELDNITYKNFKSNLDWQAIRYTSTYMTGLSVDEPNIKMPIQYTHLRNQTDEREGAKYIIAYERYVKNSAGESTPYYYPFTMGDIGLNNNRFTSNYISQGQIVAAKGVFQDGKYPTAIRSSESNDVEFYRDQIENCYVGNVGSLTSFSLAPQGDNNGFSRFIKFIRAIFDPESIVPNLSLDANAVAQTYTNSEKDVAVLKGGRVHLGYMFSDIFTTGVLKSNYVLDIYSLFDAGKINYILLVMGTILLVKVIVGAMFRLINRSFDLFLVIIIYPTACATIPLDNGGYNSWVKTYQSKLFATYGIVLGFNFVFLLFPIIQSINFFTVDAVATNAQIRRIGSLFFGIFTVNEITNGLNFVTAILFELVAFTLFSDTNGIGEIITKIAGGEQNAKSPFENFSKGLTALKNAKKPFQVVGSFAAKTIVNTISPTKRKESLNKLKEMLPGSAIASDAMDKNYVFKTKVDRNKAGKDLALALKDGTKSSTDIQNALKKYQDAQKKYNAALKDPRSERKNSADVNDKKEKNKLGVSSRTVDDIENGNVDISEISKKELKKYRGLRGLQNRRNIRRLNKKAKKQGLSEEEQRILDFRTQMRDEAKGELKFRKKREKEINEEIKKAKLNVKNSGTAEARAEAEEKLEEARNAKTQLNQTNSGKLQKQRVKQAKNAKKEQEKVKGEMDAFADSSRKIEQMVILDRLDREKSKIESKLNMLGIDIANMNQEQISQLMQGDGGVVMTDEKRELVQAYVSNNQYKFKLLEHEKQSQEGLAQRKINYQNAKEDRKRSHKNNNDYDAESDQALLEQINNQIKEMEAAGVNSSNIGRMRKLLDQQSEIQVRLGVGTHEPQEGANDRFHRSRKYAQMRRRAVDYLQSRNETVTEEKIEQYIKNILDN